MTAVRYSKFRMDRTAFAVYTDKSDLGRRGEAINNVGAAEAAT